MSSLFNSLYKYRQSDKRNSKENFLTEIFAYCLQNDSIFRDRFLNLIKCNGICSNFYCETQFVDNDFGRPDLYITLDEHTTIVIECKVDAKQEVTQLSRYSSFLQKKQNC